MNWGWAFQGWGRGYFCCIPVITQWRKVGLPVVSHGRELQTHFVRKPAKARLKVVMGKPFILGGKWKAHTQMQRSLAVSDLIKWILFGLRVQWKFEAAQRQTWAMRRPSEKNSPDRSRESTVWVTQLYCVILWVLLVWGKVNECSLLYNRVALFQLVPLCYFGVYHCFSLAIHPITSCQLVISFPDS